MEKLSSRFETGDGISIFFDEYGDHRWQRGVVLLHSLAMDRHFWAPVAARLFEAEIYSVVPDCRGHGESAKPPGPYRIERFGEDIKELLDFLQIRRSVVAGCSMGGSVALALALHHPDRIAGLSMIDSAAWFGPDAQRNWNQRADGALANGLGCYVDAQLERWFSDDFRRTRPEAIRSCAETFVGNDPHAYAESCRMLAEFDFRGELGRIHVPVSIAVGEEDLATPPEMARVLATGIASSTLTILANMRHLTPIEAPHVVAEVISSVFDA